MYDGNMAACYDYLSACERAEERWAQDVREQEAEIGKDYFRVSLDDLIKLATPEEIVAFYSRTGQPVWSDNVDEIADGLADVFNALRRKNTGFGSDEYITEDAFPFIPSRIMPWLIEAEAERRVQAEGRYGK